MSDDEAIVDIDPEILDEEGLFLDEEDDLGINLGLDGDEELDIKPGAEEEL
jgi:hypothetical protein